MHYLNGRFRNGFTKTLEEHESKETAQERLPQLRKELPEEWKVWTSRTAAAEWILQHDGRGCARVHKSGYKIKSGAEAEASSLTPR